MWSALLVVLAAVPRLLLAALTLTAGHVAGRLGAEAVDRWSAGGGLARPAYWTALGCSGFVAAALIRVPYATVLLPAVPHLLAAAAVLGVALVLALFVVGLTEAATGSAPLARLAGGVVWVYAAFEALNQLSVGTQLARPAYLLLLGGFGLAAALALGFGGRDPVELFTRR